MALVSAPRWLPQVEGWDVDSGEFPLHEDCKACRIQEDSKDQQEGGQTSKASFEINYSLDLDLHTKANNFAPNESERLSISLVLLFTKDQNTRGIIVVVIATERK